MIVTGLSSTAVFVCGRSAYMMRENSRLIVDAKGSKDSPSVGENSGDMAVDALRLLNGKMLSVFGSGEKTIQTPSAYIGVRGTGVYCEVDEKKSYVCTCYGRVNIRPAAAPELKEKIRTRHHEAPRYIYAKVKQDTLDSATQLPLILRNLIKKAPMKNHTDAELIMLEALVRRRPPFMNMGNKKGEGGGY